MILDFNKPGVVKVSMVPYVKKMLEDFHIHDDSNQTMATPAGDHFFQVNDECELLSKNLAKVYHNFVARDLFFTKRGRPDIHTAIAFLTTRVMNPNTDDWKKLIRMMRYLRDTIDLSLTLSAYGTNIVKWWFDGSHAVHPDCKGQTGGTMSMGKGSVVSASTRQKINTRSSTETEVVSADDMMPQVL